MTGRLLFTLKSDSTFWSLSFGTSKLELPFPRRKEKGLKPCAEIFLTLSALYSSNFICVLMKIPESGLVTYLGCVNVEKVLLSELGNSFLSFGLFCFLEPYFKHKYTHTPLTLNEVSMLCSI